MENSLDGCAPIKTMVEPAVPVGGCTYGPEVDVSVDGGEIRFDPWNAVWFECIVGDVLYPGKGGKVGETIDVQ